MLDTISHPLESCYLVLETEVASKFWMRQISESAAPALERPLHNQGLKELFACDYEPLPGFEGLRRSPISLGSSR
jgi:hypothetical protein